MARPEPETRWVEWVRPGDRWEKVAPDMEYTEAIRTLQIRQLIREETNRGNHLEPTECA